MKKGQDKTGIAMKMYRIERFLHVHHLKLLSKVMCHLMHLAFSCVIPPSVEIGGGTKIAHAVGIVIHQRAIIGNNCTIYQNVTIGNDTVCIGDDVLVGAGAIIMGPCKIGTGAKIGAGTFVNFDVPENATVVGPKGRIIEAR